MKTNTIASLAKSNTTYVVIQVRLSGNSPSDIHCQILTDEAILSIPKKHHRNYGYSLNFKNKLLARIIRRILKNS